MAAQSNAERQRRYRQRKKEQQLIDSPHEVVARDLKALKEQAHEALIDGMTAQEVRAYLVQKTLEALPNSKHGRERALIANNINTVLNSMQAAEGGTGVGHTAAALLLMNGCSCGAADRLLAKQDAAMYNEEHDQSDT